MPVTARVPCCVRVVHGSRARGEQSESVPLVEVLHTVSHLRARDMRGRSHARQRGGGRRVRSGITQDKTRKRRAHRSAKTTLFRRGHACLLFLADGAVGRAHRVSYSNLIRIGRCRLRARSTTLAAPTTTHNVVRRLSLHLSLPRHPPSSSLSIDSGRESTQRSRISTIVIALDSIVCVSSGSAVCVCRVYVVLACP